VEFRSSWVNQKSAQEVHLLRWNPRLAELRHLKAPQKQTAREFLDQSQALAVFNGGYFDNKGRPLGLLFAGGWVEKQAAGGSAFGGMLSLIGQTPRLWPVYQMSDSQYDQVRQAPDLRFLIQCGPRLLADSQLVSGLERNTFTRRTAIGYDDQGRLYLMATALHYTMSFAQLQTYLKDQLKLRSALNLDGGSSTQCSIRGQLDCPGFSPIPFALGVFARK
jgi:uncharacterized protein YigE (DUF2233 family)